MMPDGPIFRVNPRAVEVEFDWDHDYDSETRCGAFNAPEYGISRRCRSPVKKEGDGFHCSKHPSGGYEIRVHRINSGDLSAAVYARFDLSELDFIAVELKELYKSNEDPEYRRLCNYLSRKLFSMLERVRCEDSRSFQLMPLTWRWDEPDPGTVGHTLPKTGFPPVPLSKTLDEIEEDMGKPRC